MSTEVRLTKQEVVEKIMSYLTYLIENSELQDSEKIEIDININEHGKPDVKVNTD